jgi:hypothetical protein
VEVEEAAVAVEEAAHPAARPLVVHRAVLVHRRHRRSVLQTIDLQVASVLHRGHHSVCVFVLITYTNNQC